MSLFLNLASNQSPSQRLTSEERRSGHFKIHPVDERFSSRVGSEPGQFARCHLAVAIARSRFDHSPIANSHIVVPPLLSQYLLEQERMLSRMHAIDLVVAGHQSPGIRLSNGNLKRLEVDLPQRTLRDFRAILVLL